MSKILLIILLFAIVMVFFWAGYNQYQYLEKKERVTCGVIIAKKYIPTKPGVFSFSPERFCLKIRECNGAFTFWYYLYKEKYIQTQVGDTLYWR